MAEKGKSPLRTTPPPTKTPDTLDQKFDVTSKLSGKGDAIPNGKGDGGKGGKPAVPKAPLELKVQQDLPKNATCLMDCEAAEILQGISEQMVILSEDPSIKIPAAFDKGLKYARGHYTSPQAVRRVLEPLKKHGVSDGEMCLIANVSPESLDEVFALIPSLKIKKNKLADPLTGALSQLYKLKQSA